jgi:hypothetical protein
MDTDISTADEQARAAGGTAGIDVLGVRLAAAGYPLVTAILDALAAIVWLLLTYGVPTALLFSRAQSSVPVNGTWLL